MIALSLTPEEARVKESVRREYGVTLSDDQMRWWRKTRSHMVDKTLMPQEHPSIPRDAFISSGRHIFDLEKLAIMKKRVNEPLFVGELEDDEREIRPVDNKDGALSIWKMPREGHRYFIPADVAKGVANGCYSAAPVFDRSTWEVVAELRLRCDPGNFGRMLCTLGEYYYWAVLCPENNSIGSACIEAIRAKNYPHLFKTTDIWPTGTEDFGFPTNERTKESCISALRNAVESTSYFENSEVAINEMMAAVRDEQGHMVSERARSLTGEDKKKMYLDCVSARIIGLYCIKFLTVDETYRDCGEIDAPLVTTSVVRARPRRGRAA